MPKGHTKYTKHERLLLKTNKMLRKITARLEGAALELASRPDPVAAPKPKAKAASKLSQMKLSIRAAAARSARKKPQRPARAKKSA